MKLSTLSALTFALALGVAPALGGNGSGSGQTEPDGEVLDYV